MPPRHDDLALRNGRVHDHAGRLARQRGEVPGRLGKGAREGKGRYVVDEEPPQPGVTVQREKPRAPVVADTPNRAQGIPPAGVLDPNRGTLQDARAVEIQFRTRPVSFRPVRDCEGERPGGGSEVRRVPG